MPQLPTLTVTQAQQDRLLAVFGTVENYKQWLTDQLVNKVISAELTAFDTEYVIERDVRRAAIKSALPITST